MSRVTATAITIGALVGLVSGLVCAKGYTAFRPAESDPARATSPEKTGVSLDSIPVDPPEGAARRDPALELLASNPYEAQLKDYRSALDVDGEHPLLEDPYEDAKRFANPYENSVGIANPYVDAQRESEMRLSARLVNPYTKQLRESVALNLENPYARRR